MFIDILLQYQLQKQCIQMMKVLFIQYLSTVYYIYPNNLEYKFQFMNYFIKKNNKKGHDYFLNSIKETNYKP